MDGWSVWGPNGHEFSILRSGTEGWKFWAVSDSPGWVWRLPSGGPICVICDDWTVSSRTVGFCLLAHVSGFCVIAYDE